MGSVFLSVYGAKVLDGYRSLGLPPQFESVVKESMGGGLAVAASLPKGAGAPLVDIVQHAFIDGLSRGSIVAAVVVFGGALVSWRYLPARARVERHSTGG